MTSFNSTIWVQEKGAAGMTWDSKGLTMKIRESDPDAVIETKYKWYPPLTLSFKARTQGYGGIVNSVVLKDGVSNTGSEIDLEIVTNQFQLPLWSPLQGGDTRAHRLMVNGTNPPKSDTEVYQYLSKRTKLDHSLIESYGYRYKGYDPRYSLKYKMKWSESKVSWDIDGQRRVTYEKAPNNWDKFPQGPLNVRIGPWSTAPDASWAGKLDWKAHPTAKFRIKTVRIEGCAVIA